jgi:hypothetical protein
VDVGGSDGLLSLRGSRITGQNQGKEGMIEYKIHPQYPESCVMSWKCRLRLINEDASWEFKFSFKLAEPKTRVLL